jgi:hypothetical protein
VWTPLRDAVAQARTLDKQARKIAKQTADELYSRSEALLTQAQKRSAKTVKTVRKNVEAALETIESRTVRIADVRDWARKQLNEAETQLRNGVEVVARGLHIALDKDVDALRRKVSHLEKRVTELSGESKAA